MLSSGSEKHLGWADCWVAVGLQALLRGMRLLMVLPACALGRAAGASASPGEGPSLPACPPGAGEERRRWALEAPPGAGHASLLSPASHPPSASLPSNLQRRRRSRRWRPSPASASSTTAPTTASPPPWTRPTRTTSTWAGALLLPGCCLGFGTTQLLDTWLKATAGAAERAPRQLLGLQPRTVAAWR